MSGKETAVEEFEAEKVDAEYNILEGDNVVEKGNEELKAKRCPMKQTGTLTISKKSIFFIIGYFSFCEVEVSPVRQSADMKIRVCWFCFRVYVTNKERERDIK